MKFNFKKNITTLALSLVVGAFGIGLTSCAQWADTTLNISPNNPADVGLAQLLPSAQGAMGYTFGGDLYRYVSLWTRHHAGTDRQHLSYYQYVMDETNVDTYWSNCYANVMKDLSVLITKADQLQAPHYRGLARILMAMSLANVTDVYGDVPFSQAFAGDAGNTAPTYDQQQNIYTTIQTLLDGGIADLNATTSAFSPGSDDIMLPASLTQANRRAAWIRIANTLKARYALRLSKRNGATASQTALTALNSGMTSNADNVRVVFGPDASTANPLFQFNNQRGDMRMDTYFVTLLNTLNDPRRTPIVGTASPAGPNPGPFYASINSPVIMCHFAEAEFLQAEALFRTGNLAQARVEHIAGVRAALDMLGITGAAADAYVTSATVAPNPITLDAILTQKYIANYFNVESYNDWRRTGIPNIPVAPGALLTAIPRRFPMPQQERLYNAANYPSAAADSRSWMLTRVWWDAP
jgi:hypothetical protein